MHRFVRKPEGTTSTFSRCLPCCFGLGSGLVFLERVACFSCSEIGSLTGLELTEQAGPLASESQRSSGLGIGIKSMHHSTRFFSSVCFGVELRSSCSPGKELASCGLCVFVCFYSARAQPQAGAPPLSIQRIRCLPRSRRHLCTCLLSSKCDEGIPLSTKPQSHLLCNSPPCKH